MPTLISVKEEELFQLLILKEKCTRPERGYDENILRTIVGKIVSDPNQQRLCWQWLHVKIHNTGPRITPIRFCDQSRPNPGSNKGGQLPREVHELLREGRESSRQCIHSCPFVNADHEVECAGEKKVECVYGRPERIRAITEFCITDASGNHAKNFKDASAIFGLCGSINLGTDDGQKLAMGVWEDIERSFWVKIMVNRVGTEAREWFQDGKTEVPVTVGFSAEYVMQRPSDQFKALWESMTELNGKTFRELNVGPGAVRPTWVREKIWRWVRDRESHSLSKAVPERRGREDTSPATRSESNDLDSTPSAKGDETPPPNPRAYFSGRFRDGRTTDSENLNN